MLFARRVFLGAAVYGLLMLVPLFFMETRWGLDHPPAITHPEFFYGFIGVAVAWQILFLLIARDPVRYRPMIIPAILEKLSYAVAVMLLARAGRVDAATVVAGSVDLLLAVLFAQAFRTANNRPVAPVRV